MPRLLPRPYIAFAFFAGWYFPLPHLTFSPQANFCLPTPPTSLALLHLSRFISRLWILTLLYLCLRFLILLFKLRFAYQIPISFQYNPHCSAVARPLTSFFEECLVIALRPVSTSLPGFRNESPRQLLASVLGRGLWLTSALTALGRQQSFCPSFLLPIYSPIPALLPLPKLSLTPYKIFCFSSNHCCTLQPFLSYKQPSPLRKH